MHQLSNPQRLIYEMEKYVGGSVAVVCGSVLIKGLREPAEMIRAANEILCLNEALRTHIIERDGLILQEVQAFQEQEIPVLRFDSKEELTAYADEYAKTPVPLNGSLCELQVILLPEHCGLLAKCHHIISDAWTLTLIGSQFSAILAGKQPKAYPYSEYVEGEAAYVGGSRYKKAREFFLEQFKACDEVT